MLREEMTPKTMAITVGIVVLVCALAIGVFRTMSVRAAQAEEKQMNWQRDREMGVPDLGLKESATEEDKEVAKTQMLERQMTKQREAAPQGY